jgi:hypothetical protein
MKFHSAEFEKTLTRAWHAELLKSPRALKKYQRKRNWERLGLVGVSLFFAAMGCFLGLGLIGAHARLDASGTEVWFRCASYLGTLLGFLIVHSCLFGGFHQGYLRCPLNEDSFRRAGLRRLGICWIFFALSTVVTMVYCATGLGTRGWQATAVVLSGLWFSMCLLLPASIVASLVGRFDVAWIPSQQVRKRASYRSVKPFSASVVAACVLGPLLLIAPLFALTLSDDDPIRGALLGVLHWFPSDRLVLSFFESLKSGQFAFAREHPLFVIAVLLVPVWLKLLSKRYRYDDLLRSCDKVTAADIRPHDVATLAAEFQTEMAEVGRWRQGWASRFLFAGIGDEEIRYFDASMRMKAGWGMRQTVFAVVLWCSVGITLASSEYVWVFMLAFLTLAGLTVGPSLYAGSYALLAVDMERGHLPGSRCGLIRAANQVGFRLSLLLLPLMLGIGAMINPIVGYLTGAIPNPMTLGLAVFGVSILGLPMFSSLILLGTSGHVNLHSWRGLGLGTCVLVSLMLCAVVTGALKFDEVLNALLFYVAFAFVSRGWGAIAGRLLRAPVEEHQ